MEMNFEKEMSFEEFKDYVKEHILEYFPEDYANAEVALRDVVKNNDQVLCGLIVKKEENNVTPTFYLDDAYPAYEQNPLKLGEIMQKMADQIMEHTGPDIDLPKVLCDWNQVKDFVYPKLVNLKSNEQMLSNMVYDTKEDLAEAYYINIGEMFPNDPRFAGSNATTMITKGLLKEHAVSKETLKETAEQNLARQPYSLMSMTDQLIEIARQNGMPQEMIDELLCESVGPQMYVLSNESKYFGATMLLNENALDEACEAFGGNVYILPSSIHEVIIVSNELGEEELQRMVQEVNATVLNPREMLSDHIYEYDAKTKELHMVETDRTLEDQEFEYDLD